MPSSSCVFCRIVNRELPAEILFENEKVVAILDRSPMHFGHTLVFPKKHCRNLLDLPVSDMPDVMETTQLLARTLVHALGLEGFNVFSNNGSVAGQSVFHFHMHITPRFRDDSIKLVHEPKTYTAVIMGEYAGRIRTAISHAREWENITHAGL